MENSPVFLDNHHMVDNDYCPFDELHLIKGELMISLLHPHKRHTNPMDFRASVEDLALDEYNKILSRGGTRIAAEAAYHFTIRRFGVV